MSVLMSPIFQAPAGYIPNVRCVHPRTPASLVLRALLNLKLDKHLVFVTGWREIYTMYIYIYTLYIIVYHCISLYITVYHCISLYITVYHCISLYDYLAIYIMYIYKYIHVYIITTLKKIQDVLDISCAFPGFPLFYLGGIPIKKMMISCSFWWLYYVYCIHAYCIHLVYTFYIEVLDLNQRLSGIHSRCTLCGEGNSCTWRRARKVALAWSKNVIRVNQISWGFHIHGGTSKSIKSLVCNGKSWKIHLSMDEN